MSGYTPLFDSVLDGTLFGRWPHTGIWTCLLSQADKHGIIDKHPNLLAAKIGVEKDVLLECITDFMQPDPGSRTHDHDGRRLELLEPEKRDWGWRVLNHSAYREKARLQAKNAREVQSGKNAERMEDRHGPPETAGDRLEPPETPSPNANANTNTGKKGSRQRRSSRVPEDFQPDLEYARTQIPDLDASREAQKFRDWEFKTPRSDWAAVWRNWIETCRSSGKYAKVGANGVRWQ